MKKEGIRFHIVHSVKGGCGKTAFSLFKAMDLAAGDENAGSVKEIRANVLLLDADFKGSGLKTLIYAKDQATFENRGAVKTLEWMEDFKLHKSLQKKVNSNSFIFHEKYQGNTLNHYLQGKAKSFSDIVTKGAVMAPSNVEDEIGFNGYLDFIFCSSEGKDRDCFRYLDGDLPGLSMGKFRLRVKHLLNDICSYGADSLIVDNEKKNIGQYRDVVIDMPPGYDEYSEVMLTLLREFVRERDVKDELHYYVVTTEDRSHLDAAREALKKAMTDSAEENRFTKIYAVFSENHENEFKGGRKDFIKNYLKLDYEGITEIVCKYQQEYYDFCRDDKREKFAYVI